jgi:two-component system response regulator AtoC
MAHETILIVEDEKLIRWSLVSRLSKHGFTVLEAANCQEARETISGEEIDLVLLDYRLPDGNGIDILREIKAQARDIPSIMMTAYASVESAIEAMKTGALDYINKPFEFEELLFIIEKALETTALKRELTRVRKEQEQKFGLKNVIGISPEMQGPLEFVKKISGSPASAIFIQGESGTGKKLIASAIHYASERAVKPFLSLICSALQEPALEAELFGAERGSSSQNGEFKKGILELAGEGTVFLEEIGLTQISFQLALLRALEEKKFKRGGGVNDIPLKCCIIVSCSPNIDELISHGKFSPELHSRLHVISIAIPPLRQRREDIPLLVSHFIEFFNKEFRKNFKGMKNDALDALSLYPWPGNVRELRNVIERIMIIENKDFIQVSDLPLQIVGAEPPLVKGTQFFLPTMGIQFEELEKSLILQDLERVQGNQTKAAKLLGLTRDTLRYRLKKFEINL